MGVSVDRFIGLICKGNLHIWWIDCWKGGDLRLLAQRLLVWGNRRQKQGMVPGNGGVHKNKANEVEHEYDSLRPETATAPDV